jgi:protein NUD1
MRVPAAYDDDSPSKASSGRATADELQPLGARRSGGSRMRGARAGTRDLSRRTFSQSGSVRSLRGTGGPNATFLTECSFGVAHDRLVQVITDVQPFEPYWEELSAIDLTEKGVESVARLKEFLPRLDSLTL